jgi:hypothetical protein
LKKAFYFFLLLLIPVVAFSQGGDDGMSRKELRKQRPVYLGITAGLSSAGFRDFATSPLMYKGLPTYFSLARLRSGPERESEIGVSYSIGNYLSVVNSHAAGSTVNTLSLFYSQLYRLNFLNPDKWNVKVGGLVDATGNTRVNSSLQNNGFGIEFIPTVFGSVKVARDLSRREAKNKKFLFVRYQLNPREMNAALRLNVGVLNSSFRNGYAYTRHSSVLNEDEIFDDYEFNVFSGARLSSGVDYTYKLKNKNAVQFSYLWDAYRTGGELDRFEMVQHVFKVSLLFNTNDK